MIKYIGADYMPCFCCGRPVENKDTVSIHEPACLGCLKWLRRISTKCNYRTYNWLVGTSWLDLSWIMRHGRKNEK